MATGDQADLLARLQALLPSGWFSDEPATLSVLLSAQADAFSFVYALAAYARLQMRISTATDGFLDLIAADFFGPQGRIRRRVSETDAAFRARILAEILAEKGTRAGMAGALERLTGRAPALFEPQRPADTGAYGKAAGYGVAGGYGSRLMPCQALVQAYRPASSGIPRVAGYGISTGGYSTPSRAAYVSQTDAGATVTDADIFSAVSAAKLAGTTIWVRISD